MTYVLYADRACGGAADTIALCGRRCEGSVEVSAIGPEASASHATRIYGGRLEKRKRTNDEELRLRLVCYPLRFRQNVSSSVHSSAGNPVGKTFTRLRNTRKLLKKFVQFKSSPGPRTGNTLSA